MSTDDPVRLTDKDLTRIARANQRVTKEINAYYDAVQEAYADKERAKMVRYDQFATLIPDEHPQTGQGLVRLRRRIEAELDTMPCYFYVDLFTLFNLVNEKHRLDAFMKCMQRNVIKINNTRDLYMRIRMLNDGINEQDVFEATESQLLEIAYRHKDEQLGLASFRREVSLKIINMPQLMTWQRMYDYYKRNRQQTVSVLDEGAQRDDSVSDDDEETTVDRKYRFDLDTIQQQYKDVSPWKTVKKATHYGIKNGMRPAKIDEIIIRQGVDSFDWKKQRKLMCSYVAPRHSFVIDYMFAGKFRYLLAINVNTRKAFFAIPDEIIKRGKRWNVKPKVKDWNVKAKSAINSLQHVMSQTKVKHLMMDQEPAWISDAFKRFLDDNGISYQYIHINDFSNVIETKRPKKQNHSTTSLIDRLTRTLKAMNYNLGNKHEIQPSVLAWLINEYNNSPHSTLSKILKRQVTPNEVDNDKRLERIIVSELSRENFIKRSRPEYQVSGAVRVLNEADAFDKVKPKLLPGQWNVVGQKDGLIELEQNGNRIRVNRWMIKS